jgi:hypothetical protein
MENAFLALIAAARLDSRALGRHPDALGIADAAGSHRRRPSRKMSASSRSRPVRIFRA